MPKTSALSAIPVLLIALASGGWLLQDAAPFAPNVQVAASVFERVHHHVAERHVNAIDPAELYELAVDGLLKELGDPYAAFIRPRDRNAALVNANYGGVGMRILAEEEDGITVLEVIPNSPSSRLDIQPLDRIIDVDGVSTLGWTQQEATGALRGPRGEHVDISISRVGVADPIRYRIVREDVHLVAARPLLLEDGVGYVYLTQFSVSARQELQDAISDLRRQGATSLILDLRYNRGGILREAVEVSDLFLDVGLEVVDTRARDPRDSQTFRAGGPDRFPGLPIAIVVNGISASASEIVAGSLQDHDRALVLGTPTFGKGVMQSVFPLPGDRYLRLTTGTWFTPVGRSIHRPRSEEDETALALGSQAFNDAVGAVVIEAAEESPSAALVDPSDLGEEREVFRTAGGRLVYGGGGITPDVVIHPDTLTSDEQALRVTLMEAGVPPSTLDDYALRFALEWTRSHPNLRSDFQITETMRRRFFEYLSERAEGPVDQAIYAAGKGLIDFQLERRLATTAFGELAGIERGLRRSQSVREAISYLRQAETPQELLALVAVEPEAAMAQDVLPQSE